MAPVKDLDVVVFGASGLTGRQVAAYVARRCAEDGRAWAAAGRNPDKVRRELAAAGVPGGAEVIVADVGDPESLLAMAERAKVVLDLVGPYTLYGRPVIAACVEGGAHYADLTGEIPFVREMIDEFDSAAADAGVKIVQVSGFESLPADLAVRLAADAARDQHGAQLAEVDLEVVTKFPSGIPRPSDVISGGTLQSVAHIAGYTGPHDFTDPACLLTDPARAASVRARSPISVKPRRGIRGAAVAPMMPAAFINPAVIHRSSALAGDAQPFAYREGMALPGGTATLPLRMAAATASAAMQAPMQAIPKLSPQRRGQIGDRLSRLLPKSGFGPGPERLEDWSWTVIVEGRTAAGDKVSVSADADGHPGYLATARMLGEAGLLMAEDGATPDRAGCITPATALGTASAPRFAKAQLRFSVG